MVIDFAKSADGLVPVVVQDAQTRHVLMLGYMNEAALAKTQAEGKVTFFSRSKQRLWTKGEESGHFLLVKSMASDCDNDTLLIMAEPQGPTCHNGTTTCWGDSPSSNIFFLDYLKHLIRGRKEQPTAQSYTSSLFAKGVNKIAQKVGEEAVELVIEAKDNNKSLFLGEAADLLFHYLILLEEKNIDLDEVVEVLQQRHK